MSRRAPVTAGSEGHLLPDLRGALRDGRHGRGRRVDEAPARPRPPALARLRVPQGHRDDSTCRTTPTASLHPLRAPPDGDVRARVAGTSALDDIGARLGAIRERHGGDVDRLVHGQPGRVLATRTRCGSRASSTRSARRTTTPPPRRTSPTASPPARCSTARRVVVPIPDLQRTRLPAHGRRQPAGLARLRAHARRGSRTSCTRSSSAAAASSSSTRAAPRPRAPSSTSPSAPTPTPGCCSRCCT